nr:hypothetical protein [Escherichia coli]
MTRSRYGRLLAFTDCSGYQTRYEYDRFGQMTAVHREEGISLYRRYDNRGRLTSVKDAQGRETRYEYNAAGDLTAVITRTATGARHSTMRGKGGQHHAGRADAQYGVRCCRTCHQPDQRERQPQRLQLRCAGPAGTAGRL